MLRCFLCICLVALASLPARAEVRIAKQHQIQNVAPGYCAWCCLEMIARHQGITELYGIADYYKRQRHWVWDGWQWQWVPYDTGAEAQDIVDVLNSFLVKCSAQGPGHYTEAILVRATQFEKVPVLVGLQGWPEQGKKHAVAITHFDRKSVKFVDSNCPNWVYSASRDWFGRHWTGVAIMLLPPEQPRAATKTVKVGKEQKPMCCCGKDCGKSSCRIACDCNCFKGCKKCASCQCKDGNDCKY